MKDLSSLCASLSALQAQHGPAEQMIARLSFSHEMVQPGDLFAACVGLRFDGHTFIEAAIQRGAVAVLCEQLPETLHAHLSYVQVANTRIALAEMASTFYDHPSRSLRLVGVTGTNGKTTTATLLYELFCRAGEKAGLLATTGYFFAGQQKRATRTTPDTVTINRLLREMLSVGCTICFMEVTSHALVLHRVSGLVFCGGIFTNLTHDHLDFHKHFAAYRDAKKSFFDALPATAFALTNADDKNGAYMVQSTAASSEDYAIKRPAHTQAQVLENTLLSLHMRLWEQSVHFRLLGMCNAYNLVAAAAAAVCLGCDKISILTHLSKIPSKIPPLRGRFEIVSSQADDIMVMVDFAHTPDALKRVLEDARHFKRQGSIITLVGCGGDRDASKRSKMTKIALRYSMRVILTADNPRSEPLSNILTDMLRDCTPVARSKITSISDREEAIHTAIGAAVAGDFVLLAGKGHEDYQEIAGIRHPFSDREVAQEALKKVRV